MAVFDIVFSLQSKMSIVKYKTAKQLRVQTEVLDIMSDIFLILITLCFFFTSLPEISLSWIFGNIYDVKKQISWIYDLN